MRPNPGEGTLKMRTNALARAWSVLTMLAVLAGATVALAQKTVEPPPNAPATITWDAAQGKLSLRYHGKVIFDGTVRAEDAAADRGRDPAGRRGLLPR